MRASASDGGLSLHKKELHIMKNFGETLDYVEFFKIRHHGNTRDSPGVKST